jgi:hypothetical protein
VKGAADEDACCAVGFIDKNDVEKDFVIGAANRRLRGNKY